MKILHCIPSFLSGGAERQLSILAPAQVKSGSQVHVAFIHAGPHSQAIRKGGVTIHRISCNGNYDPRILLQLASIIERERPDVVQSWLPQMDILSGMVCLVRRVPWVMSERSSADAYKRRFKDRFIRQWIGGYADAVVANSSAGAAMWESKLREGAHAYQVPNAVPLDAIAQARTASPSELGIQPGTPVVLFVGRLSYEKNVSLLASVAVDVCERTNATFVICGEGPLRETAEAEVGKSTVAHRINFVGEVRSVWSLMKLARVFVSTSSFEGQPNAVLEAMACECPLVVSDIPAHREFLGEETAELSPLTVTAFADAIIKTLAGTAEVGERVRKARIQVGAHNVTRTALAYDQIYREALLRYNRCAA